MAKRPYHVWARSIGYMLASLQDGVDDVCKWTFAKIRSAGDAKLPRRTKQESELLYKTKKTGKTALRFFSCIGEAFHKKYGELKKKK